MGRLAYWLLFFIPMVGYCQLSNFDFAITPTHETCSGSGSLSFSPSNVLPGAIVTYYVYLQPNTTVPIKTTTDLQATDLTAGTYTITASISLNGVEFNISHDVTIQDLRLPAPVFDFVIQAQDCNNSNQIEVVVSSGVATGFEIFNGPVIVPPQTSNIFTNLVTGDYTFRVYDGCGQAISRSFRADFNPQPPQVSAPIVSSLATGNCSTFNLANTISYPAGTIFTYPVTVQYTLHASDGSPDVVRTQTITSGDFQSIEVSNVFPYVAGVTYTYDVSVVNGCGVTYSTTGNALNPVPTFALSVIPTPCGQFYLNGQAAGYNVDYNITFTQSPPGFSPITNYNGTYPGAYSLPSVSFGGLNQAVPEGIYKAFITDNCGRVSEVTEIEVIYELPEPLKGARNNGCFSNLGSLSISIPLRTIVSAQIVATTAPDYTNPLPTDVSSFINSSGSLLVTNLPLGEYTIDVVDNCGIPYRVVITVPAFTPRPFSAQQKPDCNDDFATVMVVSENQNNIVSLAITAAPPTFTGMLPFDVTNLINTGRGYVDNLPVGQYTFSGTDACGIDSSVDILLIGKTTLPGGFTVEAQCNSFNIVMADPDPLRINATYWLQQEDPATPGVWFNPLDHTVYNEGDTPSTANSILLQNNIRNFNLSFSGTFRIIKFFTTYGSGSPTKNCIKQIGDVFEYHDNVTIDNIYGINCASHPSSVYIDANGLPPLQYSIVDGNANDAVIFSNGTNPIFANLATGSYKFKVENSCGQFVFQQADVSVLPDLVDAATPPDMYICVPPGESVNVPVDLTTQNTAILNGAIASQYSVTYYTSYLDADNNVRAIPNPEAYLLLSNPQVIYAKLNQIYINVCPEIVSFNVQIGRTPELFMDDEDYLCEDLGELTLVADPGFDSYLWQPGGEITETITVTTPGQYSVTVTSGGCSATKDITVIPVEQPEIREIDTFDWTYDNNSFTVVTDVPEMYLYSIDAVNYQESNTFTGLTTGIYTVYVRDRLGCKATERELVLLYYPKFFTPNGDGNNETWRIPYSFKEPDLKVYIYDRYGKLITGFPAQSDGWNGTLNGQPLPSTDYWFVVQRQDGRIHKGHFSLIR